MKYIQNILLLFLGIVAFTTISCSEDDKNFGDTCNVRLTLQISRQEGNGTRATDDGVDALNENELNTVDLFFYKKDAAVTDAPVFFATDIQPSEVTATKSEVSVSMPLDAFSKLFPTDADKECLVYAIANRPPQPENDDNAKPDDNVLPADKSIKSLKEKTILYAPDFAVKVVDNVTNKYSPNEQYDFVMDGQAIVTRDGENLIGTIPVERVAAKISLVINGIADEVTDNGVKWRPDKDNVSLSLRRASVRTKLDPTSDENIYSAFSLDDINLTSDGTTLTTKVPFYTYPTNWKDDENSRTHFILKVNWTKEGSSEPITTYYEININPAGSYTRRNSHYKIYQEVKVLGSENEEKPLVLYPCNYVILDWGNTHEGTADTDSDANLNRFKYLVVDETEFEMENTFSKQIYFFSSDPIELTTFEAKWEYIGGNESQTLILASQANITSTTTTGRDITYTIANTRATDPSINGVKNRLQGDYSVIIKIHNADPDKPNDRSYISFQHNLNNNMDESADYTEYTFTFGVRHQDNDKYKDEIKITQYPMIAIKADLNSDYIADDDAGNDNEHKGYTYINKGGSGLGGEHGLAGSNKNPNRYKISVTALPEGNSYIIGDPRVSTINLLDYSDNFATAPTMKYSGDTNNRKLKYYYPTNESAAMANMISPQFMIASSYGVTNDVNKDNARIRCASYQEDGYPAGRWRVPTQAEIEYIVKLSAWGVIPTLFGTTNSDDEAVYWSASGAVSVKAKSGTVTSKPSDYGPVRCVYDLWYWTDKCDKTKFTWGDKENL